MCLAIPGKIKTIKNRYKGLVRMAEVSFGGISENWTNLKKSMIIFQMYNTHKRTFYFKIQNV